MEKRPSTISTKPSGIRSTAQGDALGSVECFSVPVSLHKLNGDEHRLSCCLSGLFRPVPQLFTTCCEQVGCNRFAFPVSPSAVLLLLAIPCASRPTQNIQIAPITMTSQNMAARAHAMKKWRQLQEPYRLDLRSQRFLQGVRSLASMSTVINGTGWRIRTHDLL